MNEIEYLDHLQFQAYRVLIAYYNAHSHYDEDKMKVVFTGNSSLLDIINRRWIRRITKLHEAKKREALK